MISELRINDLGVIDDATVDLHAGFTVVTGETGAGKTMIVTGLGLLLAGRADSAAVRTGAERARVEGRFVEPSSETATLVEAAGGEVEGDELLVARQITAAGRSRAWLGGAQVPLAQCGEVTSGLVSIYGQSEQVLLGNADRQRMILDRFAGSTHAGVLDNYRAKYAERQAARSELDQLRADAQARAREIDLLQFGLDEIEQVAPEPGEDVALAAEAVRLQSLDDLRDAASTAVLALAGEDDESASGVTVAISVARKALEQAAGQDVGAEALAKRVAELSYLADDLSSDVARYLGTLEVQPGRLEWIAERRSALAGLTRKYGDSVDVVLTWAQESAAKLTTLTASDDRIESLAAAVTELDQMLATLANKITKQRTTAAAKFSKLVLTELKALAMPHAKLIFDVRPTDLGPHGQDAVELLFSANPGTEPRSLARVASGGELSRVRLALEVVLADGATGRTLVFDEVDAGVGGTVAVEIGRRLATLSRRAQVVVVTHLAQVAAFADRHFVVLKASDGQVTTSGISQVQNDGRAEELARMMAGLETSDSALAHAKELIAVADQHRSS